MGQRSHIVYYLLLLALPVTVFAQNNTITGKVKDTKTNDGMPGANVVIKGTIINTATDIDGNFKLTTEMPFPFTIMIYSLGYVTQEKIVTNTESVTIKMAGSEIMLKDAKVMATRITEKQKQSPLTIETLDMAGIRETPSENFYEGLGQLRGVDLTSASIAFKVINTRGFNSTSPVRSLQLIDGVDNQSPGLNFSLGNFLGSSELDVQKVELISGASSAFFGPNAFNGVINISTRSPFMNPGLEVNVKAGERSLVETAVRWAKVYRNKKGEAKFAYKLNFSFLKALDWEANNMSATPQSKSTKDNPGGYDAVNRYGDEYITGTDYTKQAGSFPGLGVYYRQGYAEKDLVDYNTENIKVGLAFHYKINSKTEIIAASNMGGGSTIYQGDNRYVLKDVSFFQNRLEIRKEHKWFIRAYATNENSGKSYDAYFTALLLQREAKSDGDWKKDYENFWNNNYNLNNVRLLPGFPQPPGPGQAYVDWLTQINPFLASHYNDSLLAWHKAAQNFVNGVGFVTTNSPFFQPGTHAFDTALAGITSRKSYGQNGTMFYDRSALYHIQGEHSFLLPFCNAVVGANFRLYAPNSQGTIFSDTNGARIYNSEFGMYAGADKMLMCDKLKVSATLRIDKNQNFPFLASPAASFVYKTGKEDYARLTFSSAIRNPTLADQYLFYNTGNAVLIGNRNGINGLVTIPSLINSYNYYQNFDFLSFFNVKPVRPEEVKTIECGYRATLFEHLYVDMNSYFSWYKNFIGYKIGASVDTLHLQTPFGSYNQLNINNVYRVATNSEDIVTTAGFSIGINYYINDHFVLAGNYSWNKLDRQGSTDPLIPAYNTPENKFNIGFSGRDIRNYGFSLNYKWVQGFEFEGSPQFTGYIDSYGLLDVQVTRRFPKIKSVVKIGAGNILNTQHYEVYGGPLVGRMAYISYTFTLNSKSNI